MVQGRAARRMLAAGVIAGGALLAGPALAHPHVFVDARFTLDLDRQGSLTGVEVTWLFDAVYTSVILPDFDLNGDGALSAAEAEDLAGEFFAGLGEYNYFTRVAADGTWLEQVTAEGYEAWLEADRLAVRFRVPIDLGEPARIELIPFDDEVFVAYDVSIEAARAAGEQTEYACRHQDYDLESWYLGPVSTAGVVCEAAPGT